MATLIPEYISLDFNTMLERLKTNLQNSDTFADYNFEGSNIALLMELNAYIAELQTFYLNKTAKNIHIETADVYETVNRVSRQMGYEPRGYRSSRSTLSITVSGTIPGDILRVSEFTQFEAPNSQYNGDTIKFANTTQYTGTVTGTTHTFTLPVRQGEVETITGYTGSDLVDNELILPTGYAYDDDIDDAYPSIQVTVNGDPWTRLSDFYGNITALNELNDVYMFIYDRYERNKVVFNSARSVPDTDDTIALKVLKSLGVNGDVAAGEITQTSSRFVYNVSRNLWYSNDLVTITNLAESTGGADPETITQIQENARSGLHAQFRNVTAVDYKSHLETRDDVIAGVAWGEQEIAPSGSVLEYNKIHLSVIPDEWGSATISTATSAWTTSWGSSGDVMIPSAYGSTYSTTLKNFLEPRKQLTAYEIHELPVLVYFGFDWGVRIKRLYDFDDVENDIKNKLIWYFRSANQDFNSTINFNDIIEYILDTTEVSPTDNFTYIQGIRNLNLRDIDVSKTVYELNTIGNYPYYVEPSATYIGENQLRKIKLGLNQFPILAPDTIRIREEA